MGIEKDFSITFSDCEKYRIYARYLSFIICAFLVMFITVEHDQDNQESTFIVYGYLINLFIKFLCFSQLLLTLFYCYLWSKMRGKLALQAYYKEQ